MSPSGPAFLLNGDVLLLTRFGDGLVKHRATWWNTYTGLRLDIPLNRAGDDIG